MDSTIQPQFDLPIHPPQRGFNAYIPPDLGRPLSDQARREYDEIKRKHIGSLPDPSAYVPPAYESPVSYDRRAYIELRKNFPPRLRLDGPSETISHPDPTSHSAQTPVLSSNRTMAQVIKAPGREPIDDAQKVVYLAGMTSPPDADWRDELADALSHLRHVTIADPFRPDWDAEWEEEMSPKSFTDHVRWELDMQERADVLVIHFGGRLDAASFEGRTNGGAALGELPKTPVSLLELGLRAGSGRRCMVVCNDGYWRRGNVLLVCERYGIPVFPSIGKLSKVLEEELAKAAPAKNNHA
ncbi:hypothetical protein RB597_002750 [Gaeumannomyces tritici]